MSKIQLLLLAGMALLLTSCTTTTVVNGPDSCKGVTSGINCNVYDINNYMSTVSYVLQP